jgi:hypothetical protein
MKHLLFLLALFLCPLLFGQETDMTLRSKRLASRAQILIDSLGVNPKYFGVYTKNGTQIDTSRFQVDFKNALLFLSPQVVATHDTIEVRYLRYPEFMTKNYSRLDPKMVVASTNATQKIFRMNQPNFKRQSVPFDGLNTQGSIVRGLTIGNNQNAVINSQLDLQITGALNEKINIRASLQDSNLPSQDGGYSQSLDEFDALFVALYADQWRLRAGDIDLSNTNTYFGQFTKKIQGLYAQGIIDHQDGSKTELFGAGGLVRGVFQRSTIIGQEGNQGPYKLVGPNGEAYILMISGSERIYNNGVLLKRGENNDYMIDYNAGELIFNPTYPITANMRITAEYQVTERNYTRFIGYGGGQYTSETLRIGAYAYSEKDAKNQPLQQNFTDIQRTTLTQAGDDPQALNAPSERPETYSENKILYKKEDVGGTTIFVFSNNPEEELFQVRFSRVADQMGDYIIDSDTAINKIYVYTPPIDGVPQGNYSPTIRLTPAQELQLAGFYARYSPNDASQIDIELGASHNDLNLYSAIDDTDNKGYASRIAMQHTLWTSADTTQLKAFGSYNYIDQNYRTPERLYNVEFNRDWNLEQVQGTQRLFELGGSITQPNVGFANYSLNWLSYGASYQGQKHNFQGEGARGKWRLWSLASQLSSSSLLKKTAFFRTNQHLQLDLNKAWIGAKFQSENNQERDSTQTLTGLSQRFVHYEFVAGLGDSTAVFTEMGYRNRVTDSARLGAMTRATKAQDVFIKTKLIASEKAQLYTFAQYRILDHTDESLAREENISARINYSQSLWQNMLRFNTAIETNNGALPQQEFTYILVEPGQGVFTWNDYNQDGIQDLEEFEIAQFQDQATYIRVLLPNQTFIKIRKNSLSQQATWQFASWKGQKGVKGLLSHFYNQTAILIDRKTKRDGKSFFDRPFALNAEDDLGLQYNLKNTLFFNRSQQRYTTTYSYLKNKSSQLVALSPQRSALEQHQISFDHLMSRVYLFHLEGATGYKKATSANFGQRNYTLNQSNIMPQMSILWGTGSRFNLFYKAQNKRNIVGAQERLSQTTIGGLCNFNKTQKLSLTMEAKYIENKFVGIPYSAVAYTMLEGLQPGTNFTWSLLLQRQISSYLNLNLSYFGRQSSQGPVVHSGTVQLKAFF